MNSPLHKCFFEKSKKQEEIDKKQEHRRLGQKQGDLLLKAGEWPPLTLPSFVMNKAGQFWGVIFNN